LKIGKLKNIPEDQLVSLIISKDRKAIEYLYANYSNVLYGIILKVVKEEVVAEEVFHDAFIKICDKIDKYDASKGKLFTWMLNLARNQAIDKTRSRSFKEQYKSTDPLDNVSIADSDYSSKHKPEHIGVKEMLNILKPEEKDLIDLMYFKGYTQSEIAEEFNIPLGTVKTRIRSAVQKLKGSFN